MRVSIPASGTGSAFPARRRLLRRLLVAVGTPAGAIGSGLTALSLAGAALADVVTRAHPFQPVGPALHPPSWSFPMGTDDLGRSLLSSVLHGLRTSLLVALTVTVLALALGLLIGAVAGYAGGVVDDVLMRFTELVQVIPRFFLAVLVAALFEPGVDRLALVLGLTSWPWLARVARAEALALREREFVEAARSLGASQLRILAREIVPGLLPSAVVMASLIASGTILLEAAIGFIGLADPDLISLGSLARNVQGFLRTAWWMAVFPGVAIAVATLGINLLGDTLNDAMNPRARRPLPPAPRPSDEEPPPPPVQG